MRTHPAKEFSVEDDVCLRELLKRCSPSIFEAALQFRRNGEPERASAIVDGIVERYIDPPLRRRLLEPAGGLRLVEDLGMDSLTLLEVVTMCEEVFRITFSYEELRSIRTLGNVKELTERKLRS